MKIKIDLKIFLIIAFYFITKNIEIFALTFIFILIHELGHALTGIILGLKISKINITILGLSIEFENYGKERRINKIIIDIARTTYKSNNFNNINNSQYARDCIHKFKSFINKYVTNISFRWRKNIKNYIYIQSYL